MLIYQLTEEFCKYKEIECDVDVYVESMLQRGSLAKDPDLEHKCGVLLDYLLDYGNLLPVTPHSSTPIEMLKNFEFFKTILWNKEAYNGPYLDFPSISNDEYDLHVQMPCLMMSDVKKLSKMFKKFYKYCVSDYKLAESMNESIPKEHLRILLANGITSYGIMKNAVTMDLWMGVNYKSVDYVFEKMVQLMFKHRIGLPFIYGIEGGKLLSYKGLVRHEPRHNETRSPVNDREQEDSGKDVVESFSGSLGGCIR